MRNVEQICCEEKFLHMTDFSARAMKNVENICFVEKFLHMTDFSTRAMKKVENICQVEKFLLLHTEVNQNIHFFACILL